MRITTGSHPQGVQKNWIPSMLMVVNIFRRDIENKSPLRCQNNTRNSGHWRGALVEPKLLFIASSRMRNMRGNCHSSEIVQRCWTGHTPTPRNSSGLYSYFRENTERWLGIFSCPEERHWPKSETNPHQSDLRKRTLTWPTKVGRNV